MVQEKYKTFWRRLFALWIDGLLFQPLEWVDTYIWSGSIDSLGIMVWGVFYTFIGIVYYVFMHTKYGQAIGKMVTRVKVLDVSEAKNVTIYQACLREIVPILLTPFSIYIYIQFAFNDYTWDEIVGNVWVIYLAFTLIAWGVLEMITMLFNNKRRAIHDFIAQSVVVKD